ncbi:MAG: carboxymuconolactone decarboxylase family protein [Deltaproteobacteria bacterium]|nr:carboxymuconolactone decarboxylase family protein [Deltaproteobacteria bacterium]
MKSAEKNNNIKKLETAKNDHEIVDYKVTMLIAAGAAMAANCEPCLNKIVPDLIEAGVAEADIRKAVEIGQFVKDKPAAIMKEAADVLTGTHLSDQHASEGCPADTLKRTESATCGCN